VQRFRGTGVVQSRCEAGTEVQRWCRCRAGAGVGAGAGAEVVPGVQRWRW
jgi:hypothetical protein